VNPSRKGVPLKILFASTKHVTSGRHSAFMPLAIGFIAAFAQKQFGDRIQMRLLEDADEILDAMDSWAPDVVALSHYCWNAELNYLLTREAKRRLPNVLTVLGGPEFPDKDYPGECLDLLSAHPSIDFFAFGEGEVPFAALITQVLESVATDALRREPQLGFMAIHPDNGTLVIGERTERLKEMDPLPSPYLSGVMDVFFDGQHSPMVQFARGCPYSCTFCNAAQSWYNRVGAFSQERVRAELDYIAERVKDHPGLILAITDSNFGMFERDVEIATYIRSLQDKYVWPMAFDFTTGKTHYDRIMHVNDLLRNRFKILVALQSMNDETLKAVKRKNVTPEKFREILGMIRARSMQSATDLIIPLPEESKETFIDTLRLITDEGVDFIVSNTLCLLKGTDLAAPDTRKQHKMKSRWRLVARQHGTYAGEICFEVEEVCIETSTMSFAEYLECRSLGFVSIVFSDPQFDIIHRHVSEFGIRKFDLIHNLWQRVAGGDTAVSNVLAEYVCQSESELFPTAEAVQEYYSRPDVYERVLKGEIGDNLVRRFRGKIFLDLAAAAVDLAYDVLENLVRDTASPDKLAALRDARRWAVASRNIGPIFRQATEEVPPVKLDLDHDVAAWYRNGTEGGPLTQYRRPIRYRLSPAWDRVGSVLVTAVSMYGTDITLTVPRILEYYDAQFFWLQTEDLSETVASVAAQPA